MKKKWLIPVFASFMLFTTTPFDDADAASTSSLKAAYSKYIGVPYRYGGTTASGFDCSGFTSKVFAEVGVKLNRTSRGQYAQGTPVSKSNLQVGDLVFFNTSGSGISHVGIYIGNGKMVNAETTEGVTISSITSGYWAARYVGARRVTTFETQKKVEKKVKQISVDFTVYASRAEVANKIATVKHLDTSDTTNVGFVDVKPTQQYAGAIAAVKEAGIFVGDQSNKFNPASPITRGQAAIVIAKAFGLEQNGEVKTFSDVPSNHYAAEAISILASNGVTLGIGNGKFGVDDYVKLEDLDRLIERAQNIVNQ